MTASIAWQHDGIGTAQDEVRDAMRGILTNLIRARLCYRCRKPVCGCRFVLRYEPQRLDAWLIRDSLPAALVVGGCAEDLFTPPPEMPLAEIFRQGGIDEGLVAHTKEHFMGLHPSGAPKIHQVICCAGDNLSVEMLAHELAHALTESHYSERDGMWYAPHGIRWQRTFAAIGFPSEAKAYGRMIRADDRRIHVEWDEHYSPRHRTASAGASATVRP